ncbi:unnamed protein product, partial [Notodromas monacha]
SSFTKFPKADRQVYLRDNYNFDCKCVACDGDWPVLEETETREFDCARLCQKCNATLSNEEMESSVNCKECGAELDETARELAMRWRDVMQIVNGASETTEPAAAASVPVDVVSHDLCSYTLAAGHCMTRRGQEPYFDYFFSLEMLTKSFQVEARL